MRAGKEKLKGRREKKRKVDWEAVGPGQRFGETVVIWRSAAMPLAFFWLAARYKFFCLGESGAKAYQQTHEFYNQGWERKGGREGEKGGEK